MEYFFKVISLTTTLLLQLALVNTKKTMKEIKLVQNIFCVREWKNHRREKDQY